MDTSPLDGRAEQGLWPSFSFLCFSCQSVATCSLMSGQGLCGSCLSQTKAPEAGAGGRASSRSITALGSWSQPAVAEVRAVSAAPGAFLGQGGWPGCSSPAWSLLFPMGAQPRGPHSGQEGGGCTRGSAPTTDPRWLEQAGAGPGVGAECGRTQEGERELAGCESRRLEQGGHNFRARRAAGPLG